MESVKEPQLNAPTRSRRKPPDIRFPFYTLADSLAVAETIHKHGGGTASRDQLAAFLGYSSVRNGAFLSRVASARTFNLITSERGGDFVMTPLAQKILQPVYPEQTDEGLVEAFLSVPLFKAIYEEQKGKELPPEFGLKNLLRTKYGIAGRTTDVAYKALMESADQAKFFATRGTKTHLIMPTVSRRSEEPESASESPGPGDRGDSHLPPSPPPPPPASATPDQVRMEYIRKLISMLDSDTVQDKKELMDRIEALLKG